VTAPGRAQPVAVFAPGGVGNLGPGLDILGLALEGAGDTVRAELSTTPGVEILDPGHPELPSDAAQHTAGLAAREVIARAGNDSAQEIGVRLWVHKGLPLSGGQGGSAASAVAGAVATNHLLGSPLDRRNLVLACLAAEEKVAGRHADNIAPSLLGGIVLIRAMDPLDLIQLPVPEELSVVIVRPDQRLRTEEGRSVLPSQVSRAAAMYQAAQVGAIVAALAAGDYSLLSRAIDDRIAEPVRAPLLPGFSAAKRAALDAGALGCSISGSGPSSFALVRGTRAGMEVGRAMTAAYAACGIRSDARVAAIDRRGARVIPGEGPWR
jgi:homoserine kinase